VVTSASSDREAPTSALGVYSFDHDHGRSPRELMDLLGGKGAGLAEMSSVLRLPVPPGFTIAVPVGRRFRTSGWPGELTAILREKCDALGQELGRFLGDPADPLVLAVRSGAARSMPGMLDTVLNLGLNDDTVVGLAQASRDERFAWDCYRRFVAAFAATVLLADPRALGAPATPAVGTGELKAEVDRLKRRIDTLGLPPVPIDPGTQLRLAIEAVWLSWDSDRARAYREREAIDDRLGTAVNIQAMVFGNRGPGSGTGVVFTRDPSTGAPVPYGDFLPHAQGEDIVSGSRSTLQISAMAEQMPDQWLALKEALRRIEVHYRDMCDIEFTVDDGNLWLLQTRVGKRTATAAVRTAVAMTHDPDILLSREEALARVTPDVRARATAEAVASGRRGADRGCPIAVGLGASPGRACGRAVFSCDEAAEVEPDEAFILVRPETSPEDVPVMSQAAGVLTSAGGVVSHAAVVARGWGIPAVVGAASLLIRDGQAVIPETGVVIKAGDLITIDGTTGAVWLGEVEPTATDSRAEHEAVARHLPDLLLLDAWAAAMG
jgi:pyruvate,orthophosphate dikinase